MSNTPVDRETDTTQYTHCIKRTVEKEVGRLSLEEDMDRTGKNRAAD